MSETGDNVGTEIEKFSYVAEDEIEKYCGLAAKVTMAHVEAASVLIDAYKGCTFRPRKWAERVDLTYKRTMEETRGKLKHFPRIKIDKVEAKTRSAFGVEKLAFDESCLEFDSETSPYFSFYLPPSVLFRKAPKTIIVNYTSGYEEIPEAIKRATGMLACNIKQMGGVLRWKSRDDYDIKVTLGNEGVFTQEIKEIIAGVRLQ